MGILENTLEGVGRIPLIDALNKFLNYGDLNAFLSKVKIFDCGNKKRVHSRQFDVRHERP